MKRQNNFHHYVVKYHKCVRQLKRLELTGRNEHRQSILKKHIVRLLDKLNNLYLGLQKHKVATALACTTLLAVPNAQAQITFSQDNQPAGLSSLTLEDSSSPLMIDLDGDGDFDLLVGDYNGALTYFQNTGSPTQPSFAQGTLPGGLAIDVGLYSIPAICDLNNDNVFDLLVGSFDGIGFKYLQNTGTTTQPSFTESTLPGLTANDLNFTGPFFVDLDADGDQDLVNLNPQNEFVYYENIGTASQPSFTLGTLPSGLSSIMIDWSSSKALSFSDLDGDGDFDLWLNIVGELVYYENIGTPTQPSFTSASVPSGISEQKENLKSLSFADLDADGDKDMIGRTASHKFTYFENTSTVLGNATLVLEKIEFQYHALSKTLEIHSAENLKLNSIQIFDVMGKMIHQTAVKTQSDLSIRLENLSSGIYMVQVQTHQGKITRKIGVH